MQLKKIMRCHCKKCLEAIKWGKKTKPQANNVQGWGGSAVCMLGVILGNAKSIRGLGEMLPLCKSWPRQHVVITIIPLLGRQRQEDPWDSMASQPLLTVKSQASERLPQTNK